VVEAFKHYGLDFEPRVLPCGHYTTGETPYKYLDGWYLGWFLYRAFKALRKEKAAAKTCRHCLPVLAAREQRKRKPLAR
jgi:hypothetical protein